MAEKYVIDQERERERGGGGDRREREREKTELKYIIWIYRILWS